MKVALYIGDHAADGLLARLGWWITRRVQKGPYAHVTHVEAIHDEHPDGSVTIASASLRDGGVRSKRAVLNPAHWLIIDVPLWDTQKSEDSLEETTGMGYDWRGALATCLPGAPDADRWFCNEWVGHPYLRGAETFGPHHFAAICLSLGTDVTEEFFRRMAVLTG